MKYITFNIIGFLLVLLLAEIDGSSMREKEIYVPPVLSIAIDKTNIPIHCLGIQSDTRKKFSTKTLTRNGRRVYNNCKY